MTFDVVTARYSNRRCFHLRLSYFDIIAYLLEAKGSNLLAKMSAMQMRLQDCLSWNEGKMSIEIRNLIIAGRWDGIVHIINSKIEESDSVVSPTHPSLRVVLIVLLTAITNVRPRIQESSNMFEIFGAAGGVACLLNAISTQNGNVGTIVVCMQLLSAMLDDLQIANRMTYDHDGSFLWNYQLDPETGTVDYNSDDSDEWPKYEQECQDPDQILISTAERNSIIAWTLASLERFPTHTMLYEKSLEMLKNLFQGDLAECYDEFYRQGAIPKIIRCLGVRHDNLHAHGLFAKFLHIVVQDREDTPMPQRNIAIMLQLVTNGGILVFLNILEQKFDNPSDSDDVHHILQLLELIISYGYAQKVNSEGGDTLMKKLYEQRGEFDMRMSNRQYRIQQVLRDCATSV